MIIVHVVIVAAYWYYPEAAYEFPLRLVRKGHKVTAILWNQNASIDTRNDVADGFTVYNVRGVNPCGAIDSGFRYPYVFGLSRMISKLKPDIIDCQSHLFLTTVQAIRAAKDLGIPSVVTVHGVMAKRGGLMNLAQYVFLFTLGSWIFRETDLVRCLTENDAKEVAKYRCPRDKVRIIRNAVDTDFFRPKNEADKEDDLIVWTGRFVKEKGLEYLVDAAKRVVSHCNDVKFVLIGHGPLEQGIISSVDRNSLSKNFLFTGDFSRRQIAEILQKASLFALPSLREGMPFALLEAMACGAPVVGSDISGINDVIVHGQNGFLVPPKNSTTLADVILELLGDEDLRRIIGRNARQLMVEKYSWNTITSKIEKAYNEATSK